MVILRPTRKLQSALPLSASQDSASDTALGDWYVNRIVVDRRPLLVLVGSVTLLPLIIPARDVRSLPDRLASLVSIALRRMGIAPHLIRAEEEAMREVAIAPTRDRSVLGVLVDTARTLPYHLEAGRWDDTTLPFIEARLAETPWHCGGRADRVIFPVSRTPLALQERWGTG